MIKAVIADDELSVISTVKYLLELEHIPIEIVASAQNGLMAIDAIKKYRPQIVFLDIQMPLINGFQVMDEVSHMEPQTKFIVITAFESFEYAQKALRMGACDIILKPIDEKQLYDACKKASGWTYTTNELVNEVLEYIHTHYAEDIKIADLASAHYTTSSGLARLFRRHMNVNLLEYIHQVRIRHALRLLSAGSVSIKSVAEQTGYNSLAGFYKHFKEQIGVTPMEYKKNLSRS